MQQGMRRRRGEARTAPISNLQETSMKRTSPSPVRPLLAVVLMAMFGVAAAQTTGSGMGATGATGSAPASPMGATGTRSGASDASHATQFRTLDKSNRGYLQRNDVTGISGFSFDQADVNHDGRVSQDEFAQWQAQNSRAGGAMGNGSGMGNSGMPSGQGGSSGTTR
jgi:hypothetical protein